MVKIQTNTDGTLKVEGVTAQWLQKAVDHQVYLDWYRKQYSQTRKAKLQAVRQALQDKGVDVKKLEAEAVKQLRKS